MAMRNQPWRQIEAGATDPAEDVARDAPARVRQEPPSVLAKRWERRREPRRPAQGEVWLWTRDPGSAVIHGRLVDLSNHGFRAAHSCQNLQAGGHVRFQHAYGRGTARVVWNRILAGGVESGFLVL